MDRPEIHANLLQHGSRVHPLATVSFIVAVAGIVLFGLLTGAIAAILAGVALGQIAVNPRLRGQALAVAAIALGIADMVLWVALIGIVLPRMNVSEVLPLNQTVFPSFHAPEAVPETIRKAMEANVFVVVDKPRRWPFLGTEAYSGSGVILYKSPAGCIILTNRHVVDPYYVADDTGSVPRQAPIQVYFPDATSREASVWWVDPLGADMALVATGRLPRDTQVPLNDSVPEMRIGDKVFAVGNPHELSWSYSEGVISGMREFPQGSQKLTIYQLQVPINQGNSGGGLYAMDGTLIGIISWTKNKAQAEGIGFAIRYQDFVAHYKAGKPGN